MKTVKVYNHQNHNIQSKKRHPQTILSPILITILSHQKFCFFILFFMNVSFFVVFTFFAFLLFVLFFRCCYGMGLILFPLLPFFFENTKQNNAKHTHTHKKSQLKKHNFVVRCQFLKIVLASKNL